MGWYFAIFSDKILRNMQHYEWLIWHFNAFYGDWTKISEMLPKTSMRRNVCGNAVLTMYVWQGGHCTYHPRVEYNLGGYIR